MMTTLTVDIENEEQERVLLAFLTTLKYNYRTEDQFDGLTEIQKKEILRRDDDFKAGKTTSEPWEEVKKRFLR